MRRSFETDSDGHYSSAGQVGTPYKICQCREEANDLRDRMDAIGLRGEELSDFSENCRDILLVGFVERFNSLVEEHQRIEDFDEIYELTIPNSLTDEQLIELSQYIDLSLFFVARPEISDDSSN